MNVLGARRRKNDDGTEKPSYMRKRARRRRFFATVSDNSRSTVEITHLSLPVVILLALILFLVILMLVITMKSLPLISFVASPVYEDSRSIPSQVAVGPLRKRNMEGLSSAADEKDGQDEGKVSRFQERFKNVPPCDAPMEEGDINYTLVTHCSENRMWMIKHHCERWGRDKPISVAIFTNRSFDDTLKELLEGDNCKESQLQINILNSDGFPDDDYPVNSLRNLAISGVQTSHIVYLDVDFWPSKTLNQALYSPNVKQAFLSDPKLALVIPVFQILRQCSEYKDCRDKNIRAMPDNYEIMRLLYKDYRAKVFDYTNFNGHGSTDYKKWLKGKTQNTTVVPITCFKSYRYEPYVALRYCDALPPFQEEFTGYGKNKLTWIMHLRRTGYDFRQISNEFAVHYPHLASTSRTKWNNEKRVGREMVAIKPDFSKEDPMKYKRGQVDALFLEFRNWLETSVKDTSRLKMCNGSDKDTVDDSKLWVKKLKKN